ncbi:Retrotrans gag domain-containing protein [Abeliophyllum distichum]|uniref:Retrotrans gag domain-containing protein n=1 Tax=Abeliophyllum distichum TaxID=126358 RepID=A0ABD1V1G7_9LAMI
MWLFLHTLKDKAREWLNSLPPRSITTWIYLIQKFTLKYFPPVRVNRLKYEISNFQQSELENFYEAWKKIQPTAPKVGMAMGLVKPARPIQNELGSSKGAIRARLVWERAELGLGSSPKSGLGSAHKLVGRTSRAELPTSSARP